MHPPFEEWWRGIKCYVFMSVSNIVYWCTFESTTQACERTQIFKAQINVSLYLCVSAIANRVAAAIFKGMSS